VNDAGFGALGALLRSAAVALAVIGAPTVSEAGDALRPFAELDRHSSAAHETRDWALGLALEVGGTRGTAGFAVREEEFGATAAERSIEISIERGLGRHLALGLTWSFDPEAGVRDADLVFGIDFSIQF